MAKHGFTTLICDSQFDAEMEGFSIQSVLSRMPDYVIVAPATLDSAHVARLLEQTSNAIVFDRAPRGTRGHFIDVDYSYGGYISACELLGKGHRDILVVTEPQEYPYSAYYIEGIRKAFAEYEVPFRPEYLRFAHSSLESSRSIVLSLWDQDAHSFTIPFTAAMCFSDNFALGAYKAIRQLGFSVPDDISVVGFDDNDICEFAAPSLTSVHLPKEKMAAICLDILEMELIAGQPAGYSFTLSPHLVGRESIKVIY